jgi:hypothetical protein
MDELEMLEIVRPIALRDRRGVLKVINGEYPTLTELHEMTISKFIPHSEILLETPKMDGNSIEQLRRRQIYFNRYQQKKLICNYVAPKQKIHESILTPLVGGFVSSIIFFKNIVYKTMKIIFPFCEDCRTITIDV